MGWPLSLRDGQWILRIGELRQETRKAGIASSTSRGILCEVTWTEAATKNTGGPVSQDDQDMMGAFLEQLLDGTGVRLDGARSVAGYTFPAPESKSNDGEAKETNWALAELYTELLRTRS